MAPVIDLDEAQGHVLARCHALRTIELPLAEAMGLVLAEDVVAGEDVPPFANSAVDGYAVRSVDVAAAPVELEVSGETAAGAGPAGEVVAGRAVRIMTGAPMPPGADAVVMVETTERLTDGSRVLVREPVAAGEAVRGVGDDVRAGTPLFAHGTVVRPAVAGVLASVDARTIAVTPRPRVAVMSTGDELVDDGSPLGPGQIRESNKTMLLGLVAASGCTALDRGIVRDDEVALEHALRSAADVSDAIVTSGGVSMGDYDVVKAVLSRIADVRWMQIAIKPAKPFTFGVLRAGDGRLVPVFGLPGNPVSSLVSFELLARPGLRALAGHVERHRPLVVAVSDEPMRRRRDGKVHFARVRAASGADGLVHVRPVAAQGSHQLAATALADALAVLPDGDGVAAGGRVDVLLLT